MELRLSQKSTETNRGNRHANQMIALWPYKNQEGIRYQVIWDQRYLRERKIGEGATGRGCTIRVFKDEEEFKRLARGYKY